MESVACRHVGRFEIGQFIEHLCRRQARCEQVQHVGHTDAQASYTGTAAALFRVHDNPFGQWDRVYADPRAIR